MTRNLSVKLFFALLLVLALLGLAASPAAAQAPRPGPVADPYWNHPPVHHGPAVVIPPARVRHYHDIVVIRPHGHWYPGYGRFLTDAEAYPWLAFTAITLRVFDTMSEAQQRAHETAQVQATTAAIGDTIVWNEDGASGSVTALRDGTSTNGRYCREFRQTVTVGGKTENAYGVACRQPDGAWEIVSTGS